MGCSAAKISDRAQLFTARDCKFHDAYSLGRMLGAGAYGTVFLASRRDSEAQFAAKIVAFTDRDGATDLTCRKLGAQRFRSEHTAWTRIGHHPNVVSFIEWHADDKLGYYVMELCNCSLLQALESERELNEHTYATYFADMLRGLRYVHSRGFVHRDVKHDNFLIGGSTGRTVKLCDFGFTTALDDKAALARLCGTVPYMAPEVTAHAVCGSASDVWSLGVVVYVSFFGQWPYCPKEISRQSFCEAIRTGAQAPEFKPPKKFNQRALSSVAVDFVRALLNRDPNARPSAADCLEMEYIVNKDIYAMYADSRGLLAISLQPVLKSAINRCALKVGGAQAGSHTLSLVKKQVAKAQATKTSKRRSHKGKCKVQPECLTNSNPCFDDIFSAAQAIQDLNKSQEHFLRSDGGILDGDVFDSLEAFRAAKWEQNHGSSEGGSSDATATEPVASHPLHPFTALHIH